MIVFTNVSQNKPNSSYFQAEGAGLFWTECIKLMQMRVLSVSFYMWKYNY